MAVVTVPTREYLSRYAYAFFFAVCEASLCERVSRKRLRTRPARWPLDVDLDLDFLSFCGCAPSVVCDPIGYASFPAIQGGNGRLFSGTRTLPPTRHLLWLCVCLQSISLKLFFDRHHNSPTLVMDETPLPPTAPCDVHGSRTKLVRLCPRHAKRFARATIPILRNLPPLTGETAGSAGRPGGGDGSSSSDSANDKLTMAQASLGAAAAAVVAAERSAAATETLLALRRPLEAFLRAGVASVAPGSSASWPPSVTAATPRKRRSSSVGSDKTRGACGSDDVGEREDNTQRLVGGSEARSRGWVVQPATEVTVTAAAAYPELVKVLLPRCIVPLFEAAAGGTDTAVMERREGAREREIGREGRQERSRGLLSCLEAVLEVSPGSGSGSTAAGAALDALRK